MQTLEELMELQSALFENVHRGTDNRENIVEEVADVEVMLAQVKEMFNITPEEIQIVQDDKLARLEHTIDKYLAKQEGKIPTLVQIDRDTSNGK
jgi:uncharacterized protein YabN with tetrapyrrole methylase and pyrophosphatase domain